MERWQKGVIAALAALSVILLSFGIGYAVASRSGGRGTITVDTANEGFGLVRQAYQQILTAAVDPPSIDELAEGAVRGMVKVLRDSDDPYAAFYSPKGYEQFRELTTGRFSGIGVWLDVKKGELIVQAVLEGTPAEEAGLQEGDIVAEIEGDEVGKLNRATVDQAVARIKGPEGTEVDLTIERDGSSKVYTITRREIELPALSKTLDEDVGVIRLVTFSEGVGDQVKDAVEQLRSDGAEGIVLDLRDNGGGLFAEAINVASVFMEEGTVVIYKEKDEEVPYEAKGDAFEDIPLVVLVNGGSASASEIVTGALQDSHRAVIVGTTTYGKGSVQQVLPLLDASALKITTAAYLTPSGHNINHKGIEPDVVVDASDWKQRQRAEEILRGVVLSTTDSSDQG